MTDGVVCQSATSEDETGVAADQPAGIDPRNPDGATPDIAESTGVP